MCSWKYPHGNTLILTHMYKHKIVATAKGVLIEKPLKFYDKSCLRLHMVYSREDTHNIIIVVSNQNNMYVHIAATDRKYT